MSSEKQVEFTKEKIDLYLKEVAKEYRKQVGKNMPAEFVLIGGASVLINYGFRNMTTDIDALIEAASAMRPRGLCSPGPFSCGYFVSSWYIFISSATTSGSVLIRPQKP